MENSNINQITIGTLNSINNPYSIGSIEGLNFIACAIGSHLHILTERFEKIHVILCDNYDSCDITAVSCCSDSGKIAICFNKNIKIYEPIQSGQKNFSIFLGRSS
jgi:hypothetical protein